MNYRFEITKPNTTDFRCEIAIGAEQTFQQFHDKIVETLGFDASQMASFFTLDRYGNRVKEISLMEMSMGDGDDEEGTKTLVMDSTTIRDAINAACIELDYVYDFFSNKYLRVEYAGENEWLCELTWKCHFKQAFALQPALQVIGNRSGTYPVALLRFSWQLF